MHYRNVLFIWIHVYNTNEEVLKTNKNKNVVQTGQGRKLLSLTALSYLSHVK